LLLLLLLLQVGPDICGFLDTALASAEVQGFKGSFSTKTKADAVLDDKGYEQLCNRWGAAGNSLHVCSGSDSVL
jgi:hypothetical protein